MWLALVCWNKDAKHLTEKGSSEIRNYSQATAPVASFWQGNGFPVSLVSWSQGLKVAPGLILYQPLSPGWCRRLHQSNVLVHLAPSNYVLQPNLTVLIPCPLGTAGAFPIGPLPIWYSSAWGPPQGCGSLLNSYCPWLRISFSGR